MHAILKFFGLIYLIIWSVIGLLILIGLIFGLLFVQGGGPQRMMGSALPMMGALGGGTSEQGAPSISPELKACLVKTVGEKRMNELLNGAQPSSAEMKQVGMACGKLMPGTK